MSFKSAEKKSKKGISLVLTVIPLLALVVVIVLGIRLHEREQPTISFIEEVNHLGADQEIGLVAADRKSGIRKMEVLLVQGDQEATLFEKNISRQGYFSNSGPNRLEELFQVNIKDHGFQEGDAKLVVAVRDFSWWNWLQGNVTTLTRPVVIDTRPPMLSVQDATPYIRNGGTGVVVYRANEPLQKHGVVFNDHFHPGHPLADRGKNVYVAYVSVPFDAEAIRNAYVSGVDEAGNEGQAPVGINFKHKTLNRDRINISDGFLNKKLPEFAMNYELFGTPVEKYVMVNNQIRKENNDRIREICSSSSADRLWEGAFTRMARSSRRSGFADHRTYYYQGKKIDEQYHLGLDLASVKHAEVEAANRGVVAFADYLGIYGNTVIVDHGQGLFSLYSHLSQIKVAQGDAVEQGAVLGLTGTTGMAGGDHLHYSMLVNGIFVDPVEWWDPHWIKVSILDFL